ncbi:hypothetical protein PG994_014060 [Apiospora phragmitis]|uniref:DUF1565 domain-containing protein n=1 Tax=Apiospora phragmitis TaxID=2905665 RepID=A0ABR1T392_9PEZI
MNPTVKPSPLALLPNTYPLGTSIENIAVRASGELLLTLLNTPHVDQIDPSQPHPQPATVKDFSTLPIAAAVLGIAEINPGVFAVAAGNYTRGAGPEPGSWSVWQMGLNADGNGHPADTIRLIADIPEALFLNGMASLPSSPGNRASASAGPKDILVGDIHQGLIYHVDTVTGSYHVVVNDSLTAAMPHPVFGLLGVNGIHADSSASAPSSTTLYFTNTGQGILAKVPIDPAAGAYDDFAVRGDDVYLVTGSDNSVEKRSLAHGGSWSPRGRVIVGGNLNNSTEMVEPTACAFGRTEADAHVLYVVTAGTLATPINGPRHSRGAGGGVAHEILAQEAMLQPTTDGGGAFTRDTGSIFSKM